MKKLLIILVLILIKCNLYAYEEFIDPNPSPGNGFGDQIVVLNNGNVVITSPYAKINGMDSAGAVYLYNGKTHKLMSRLTGGKYKGLKLNCSIVTLPNSNFLLIGSTFFQGKNKSIAYLTLCKGDSEFNETLEEARCLVGETNFDFMEYSVKPLKNDKFLFVTPHCNLNSITNVGAVTLCDGINGTTGVISDKISLVGSTTDDFQGFKIDLLKSGNILIRIPNWDNGLIKDAGAVILIKSEGNYKGAISKINALVGTHDYDYIGMFNPYELTNGNFLLQNTNWNNGKESQAGALTWCELSKELTGEVSSKNSLVGYHNKDLFSMQMDSLKNGNAIAYFPLWDNGNIKDAGAFAFINCNKGLVGEVNFSTCFVGTNPNNLSFSIIKLSNSNYLIANPNWSSQPGNQEGMVAWCDGNIGKTGEMSAENSLVGSYSLEGLGSKILTLKNGNYIVTSDNWANSKSVKVGASILCDGTKGIVGTINSKDALIGSTREDFISSKILELNEDKYLIINPNYDNGTILNVGAVTMCSSTVKTVGVVNENNSLIGSAENDKIGSDGVTILKNGNFVILSSYCHNGKDEVGAISFRYKDSILTGKVSISNSLFGAKKGEGLGRNSITLINNGNYIISSNAFRNKDSILVGAIMLANGNKPLNGILDESKALIGNNANITESYKIIELKSNKFIIHNPFYNNHMGFVAICDNNLPTSGIISEKNSYIGSQPSDSIGGAGIFEFNNGNLVILSPSWSNGAIKRAGAITYVDINNPKFGLLSKANSLVGTQEDDNVGFVISGSNKSNILIGSSEWNNGNIKKAGAITHINENSYLTGELSAKNSLVCSVENYHFGKKYGNTRIKNLNNGDFVITDIGMKINNIDGCGFASISKATAPSIGEITNSNSLIGTRTADHVGLGITELNNGNILMLDNEFNNENNHPVGALTFINAKTDMKGYVNNQNSFIGNVENAWLFISYNDIYSQMYLKVFTHVRDTINLSKVYIFGYGGLSGYPFSQASNLQFSNISKTSMKVSWTRGTGDRCLLLAKEDNSIPTNPVADGTYYPANSSFASAGQVNGCKVVYDGGESNPYVNLTDLTPNKTYYFKALEYNNMTNPLYKQNDTTGNPLSTIFSDVKENQELSINADFIYPNPTSDFIKIKLNLKQAGKVNISIIDQTGKVVKNMYENAVDLGFKELEFNLSDLASGVYLVAVTKDYESAVYTIEKMR